MLDVSTLEGWLWDGACQIRGPLDAPKFKDYILPLISLKRLSDVFEDELDRLTDEFGDREVAATLVAEDHGLVRFYVPPAALWPEIARRTTGLGEYLTDAVRAVGRENPRMQGVIDMVDFNATAAGQRIVDDGRLAALVGVRSRHRLGLHDVEPDILGRAYEYLLRKFAEGQGQSAGEFYTPPEVAWVMVRILDPQPGMTVYDPACGSGGLLIKCHLRLLETHGEGRDGHRELPAEVPGLPSSSADWGWVQHMAASLGDAGRMAVVLDTGAVSRGSGNTGSNRERDIRKLFVEGDLTQPGDLIESVVLLPENLFYNTSAPGIVMVVNRRKRKPGEILLINASKLFAKGRPKNYLEEQHIVRIAELYRAWEPVDGLAAVITTAEAARNDYNLSPSRYVSAGEQDEVLPLEEAMVLLREAEEERAAADEELEKVLVDLGLGGFRRG